MPSSTLRSLAAQALTLLLVVLCQGCATSFAVRTAESGDLAALRRAIADETRAGRLDSGEVRSIARALGHGEIARARGAAGVERVRDYAPCARELDDAFDDRADDEDQVAAAATLIRYEARLGGAESRARDEHAHAAGDDAETLTAATLWRAADARTRIETEDGDMRRKLVSDGDEQVRIAALRACIDAADPRDTHVVIEAARLDPNPLARTLAVRAAGAIGGERIVLALRDLWATADERLREAIADAWAADRAKDAGGARELLVAAESERGSESIAAAYALVRIRAHIAEASGVLTRAIESGSTKDRVFAIRVAPWDNAAVRSAIGKAELDRDDAVAIAAMARHLDRTYVELESDAANAAAARDPLAAKLLRLANGESARSLEAQSALARVGLRSVIPLLRRGVAARDERVRLVAARELPSFGQLVLVAPLLADGSPRVRSTAVCSVLRP